MSNASQFAVCIFADKEMLVTPRKIYQVLPDASAQRSEYVRVIDDEGEDYLYPKKYFVLVPVSKSIGDAILQAA
jgi:hypothetical protein